ncbi:hypothetical protein A33Q_2681 [Indibacter alkaliphilus LW1]|uniref:Magnesium citrate secondary transporter n=1 Tax=Indibacter alkaliphilus (strain CCUG 57479 / KCTC 22604 / LW1) TaxID=1189612 RepID=S2E1Z9_INDAL|nr:hypothetical protein [Indibacter alkaliphilus]EOZ96088.1 hypothetical protein A33Q_2681 [Indibacter alkaliphilus LW1]
MTVFKNPWFLTAATLFWINQLLEKVFVVFIPFVHAYLDDLMAMPVVLGITLQVYRWIHPAKSRFTFTWTQVLIAVLYFSFLFEWLLPKYSNLYTSDYWDILAYAIGAIFFYYLINVPSQKKPSHENP